MAHRLSSCGRGAADHDIIVQTSYGLSEPPKHPSVKTPFTHEICFSFVTMAGDENDTPLNPAKSGVRRLDRDADDERWRRRLPSFP